MNENEVDIGDEEVTTEEGDFVPENVAVEDGPLLLEEVPRGDMYDLDWWTSSVYDRYTEGVDLKNIREVVIEADYLDNQAQWQVSAKLRINEQRHEIDVVVPYVTEDGTLSAFTKLMQAEMGEGPERKESHIEGWVGALLAPESEVKNIKILGTTVLHRPE